ncbi:hypothetical protein F0521_24750 [Ferrimonas sp. YFM]|nr:hypothetical protein F0521_24750 [Ferrimonas sp. YFM]
MFSKWFMPDSKTRCYSYIRWSSEKQAHGTTLARQKKIANEIADENGLELVELVDEGLSAFKGKHRKDGALGAFIEAVRNKHVPADSWLVVENLDRLSREDIMSSLPMFMQLLELGITIVTGMDRKVYSGQSVIENPMDLMHSILLFSRAHEESKTKSKRTYGHAQAIVTAHNNGKRSPEGYAYAIKSVGTNIWWSDCSDEFVRPHAVYYEVAKEIVGYIKQGLGNYRIIELLNAKYPPPTKNKHNSWSANLISKFHLSRALLGEKCITLNGVEYVLEGYYPALVSEDEFHLLQAIKKSKTSKTTATTHQPLLSGIKVLRCGECGGSMYAFTQRDKPRYICGTGQQNQGCRPWSFNGMWVEDTVLRLAANHVFRPFGVEEDMHLIELALRGELKAKNERIDRLVEAIADGTGPAALTVKIKQLEQEVEETKKKIEQAVMQKQAQLLETVEWDAVDERVLDNTEHDLRAQVRTKLARVLKQVSCYQIKQGHVAFLLEFINGKQVVAHRTAQTLLFDSDAWRALGDHYGKRVLLTDSEHKVLAELDALEVEEDVEEFELPGGLSSADFKLPDELVGVSESYEYPGIGSLNAEFIGDSEELAADRVRLEHLLTWAMSVKGTPNVIEDQYQVFKHRYKSRVVTKPEPAAYYVDGVRIYRKKILID